MTLFRGVVFAALYFYALPFRAQEVALTFDDLPRTGLVPRGANRVEILKTIIRELKDGGAPRVYGFVNGNKLRGAPDDIDGLKAWTEAGFPLGNHGYSHLNLAQTSLGRYARDILSNEKLLRSLVPKEEDWRWYRFPYLEEGESRRKHHAIMSFLRENKYRVAEVSLDFQDFRWNAPFSRCVAQGDQAGIDWLKANYLIAAEEFIDLGQKEANILFERDIKHVMLLHVGVFETVMLPDLLKLFEKKHFKLTTLEDAAADAAYQNDPNWPTRRGGTFLDLMMHSRGIDIPQHRRLPVRQLNSICR